jgi:hypothetical protein
MRAASKAWSDENRERTTAKRRLGKYGLTPDAFETMLAAQAHRCALCTESFGAERRAVVDHDHATGKVRGLLCDLCNRLLGYIEHPLAARAAAYLVKYF